MITQEDLKTIRERGYSDDEIWSKLTETNSDFSTVKERGYSLEEVASITSGKPMPEPEPVGISIGDTLQTTAEELEAGVGRAGSAFAKSAVGSVRMFTDLFGANNKVSKEIAGVEDYIDQFTTAQAKQDKEEISRLFQEAEGKGLGNKVMAALKAVAVSPETLGPEMAGYMLPSLAAGLLTGGASIPVQIGAQATIGAAQAAGSIKGDIYQSVRDYSREQGLDEVEADRAATEAQSYGGKNLDLILTNAGIGALAASTGAERIATRILTGRGKDVTKKTLGEFLKQGAMAGGVEAITEGTQEAAEQISQNIAMQREGKDVPTFQNVPQVATMGAVAGGVIGGGLKGVEFLSAEEKAEQDINRSADREARLLSATDSTTKKVINNLNQSENAIDSLRQELDTLEPADPKAQQLRMRISEEQKKAVGLKQSLGEEFLSEPITETEKQQIELAKVITAPEAAPAEPTIKESLTVQPAPAPVEQVVTPPVEVAPLPARTVEESIQNKDTFEFEGMRGAVSLEDGTAVFRPFGTNDKYEVPINPNQAISEIEGIQWVRKGQTRQAPVEPTIPEVAAIVESQPQITEEEFNATEDDFQLPLSLIEIEKSPTLNAIADIFNTGESKIAQEDKRAKKVSATPEFYRQITPEQVDVANKQIDNALRIIDNLPVSEEQKQTLAEPYLLIDQDISTYENNRNLPRFV